MKIDVNLLPEEYRPKRWALPLAVGLIIVILAAGYYAYGVFDKSALASSELDRLQSQLDSVNSEIEKVISNPEIKEYTELVASAQQEVDKLKDMEQDYETYNTRRIYWKPVFQTIRELAPSDIILTNFEQDGNEITVKGELGKGVQNSIIVVEFAEQLENRGVFSRVAFEIDVEKELTGEDSKTEDIIVFTLLLEVATRGG